MPTVVAFALPELWVAVAVLLLLWAVIYIFQKPIAAVLGLIPAIGGQLADAFARGLGVVVSWAANWAATAVRPLVELVSAPVLWLVAVLSGIIQTAEALAQAIIDTAQVAGSVAAALSNRLFALVSQVATIAGQVAGLVVRVAHTAAQLAWVLATGLPNAVAAAVAQALAAVRALVSALVGPLARGLDALRAWATEQVAALTRGLEFVRSGLPALIAAAVAVAVRPVVLGLDGLGRTIGQWRVEVDGKLGQITSALAALLALDLVRVVPQVIAKVTQMERECVAPTCGVMGPQLGMLQSLMSGLEMTILLGLVAEAVADPKGTARTTAGDAQGLQGMTRSIIGGDLGFHF